MRIRNWILAVCALGLLSTLIAAQQRQTRDPQSSYEPRSTPGEGQKYLQRFVGTWEVTKTFYPRSGQPAVAKGECVQSMINDNRFLKSEFTFHSDSGDTTGLGLIGFEPETGKFTSVWLDSRQTRISMRQADEKFDGHEIHLVGKVLGEEGKTARRSHTISRIEDDNGKITHKQFTAGPDGKDRLVMELVMTRKPA
jgi:hypothetical protein